jgi:hypothetical protein
VKHLQHIVKQEMEKQRSERRGPGLYERSRALTLRAISTMRTQRPSPASRRFALPQHPNTSLIRRASGILPKAGISSMDFGTALERMESPRQLRASPEPLSPAANVEGHSTGHADIELQASHHENQDLRFRRTRSKRTFISSTSL